MDVEEQIRGIDFTVLEGPYTRGEGISDLGQVFVKDIISKIESYKQYAAEELINLYNETWFDESIGILDKAQLRKKLINPSVVILDSKGAASIFFEESNVFGGHLVEVSIVDHQIYGVELMG